MAYNLIEEAWIPVLREEGRTELIAPWQMTEAPLPLRVAAPRPDFTGALTEFLIGLTQTCMSPGTEREWRKLRDTPQTPEALREVFQVHSDAFQLDGDGPRFMQDLTLTPEEAGKPDPIGSLLIESPGANTSRHNTDLFTKRGRVKCLCPSCAAVALFTLQCFAPAGGRNIRTSIRGGGPLGTLVLGKSLWETVWNNVLTTESLNALGGDASAPKEGGLYPWLAPTRMSTKGEEIHLVEVHPFHNYWGMPRRIRLLFENGISAECGVCSKPTEYFVSSFFARPGGYNYAGSWLHPLSPIREMNQQLLAVKGSSDGLGYQNWLGLVYREVDQRKPVQAAPVVRNYREHRVQPGGNAEADFRIWAYGYDMDNMKARSWCEGAMPAWSVGGDEAAQRLALETSRLIRCSTQVHDVLQWSLREAFFSEFIKARKQATYTESISTQFWSGTRGAFFNTLAKLVQDVRRSEEPQFDLRLDWLGTTAAVAKEIYTHLTEAESLMASDPKAYARGWNVLRNNLSLRNKKMEGILDLHANNVRNLQTQEGR